jgi:transcriptional regulator with XRE-family HTH domain
MVVAFMSVSRPQVRAARALLKWTQENLAEHATVGVATVRRYEMGRNIPEALVQQIVDALLEAGVIFIVNPRKLGSMTVHTGVALREGVEAYEDASTARAPKPRAFPRFE